MTEQQIDEAYKKLQELHGMGDTETAHQMADKILLELINNPAITEVFNDLDRWYA